MIMLGGFFKLLADLFMYVGPMLIDDIVQFVQIEASESEHNTTVPQVC